MILIGYDATSTAGPRTGIGVVASQLLSALAEELPEDWRISAWVNAPRHRPPAGDPWMRSPKVDVEMTPLPGRALLWGWRHAGLPKAEMLAGPVDIFHSPASYVIPTRRAKRVITVHDLHFLDPAGSRDPRGGGYFAETFPKGLPAMDRIIAVSNHTRDELLRAYELDPAKVVVIHNGVDHAMYGPTAAEGDAAVAERALGSNDPYFFCLASFSPRKNLPGLIEAYARARAIDSTLPKLLLAGEAGEGDTRRAFEESLEGHGLSGHVVHAGYVDAENLPALYRRAAAFIMPSLSEGFGLPVLEAMACGGPVIASRAGALPEIAGEAAVWTDPVDPGSLAQAMVQLWSEADARAMLREKGLVEAAKFRWDHAARRTLEVYRGLLG